MVASAAADDDGKIQLIAKTVQEADIDIPPTGEFGIGDGFVFSDDLFEGSKKVGESGGQCTFVRLDEIAQSATIQCIATFSLPKGQITVQGLISFVGEEEPPFVVPITGGSGAYKNAHGELRVEPVGEDDRLTLFIQ
jgi:allene oxide cyclase-like protein